ncbi:Glycyl-tRNA synthetase beta subunit [Candidatus Moranella endobia PCVAL]|uniref:Glycine--tRNA ligase beta subunit n=1 Tax=Moranella endobia (strain PCIT) TaxID=903503 RepID=F7XXN0_MOREP|nr:glycine--tRNA ligase subunit beta [Candidatus Moranella endobia]AEI74856.1 putative glycyl-tRNA synthetase subunit beta [Candidatus Moranella endobia PCIT]AGJ61102.1 Glycyl-tRNA synthetase beta subunit [Candidatus Moranella endobia PCVAL]
MIQKTFLVEIGTEELPPKALRVLAEAFATQINIEFNSASVNHGEVSWFAAPRRLAVKVSGIDCHQAANRYVEKRGPAIFQAFDAAGNPTKAAKSWANSCGITLDQAEQLTTEKGEWLVYRDRLIQPWPNFLTMVISALSKIPIPKIMRWGENNNQFIRPVHTVTMLLDESVIHGKVLGVNAARILHGNRFIGEWEIHLEHAEHYPQVLLTRGRVIADYWQRKDIIRRNVAVAAKRLGGVADLSDDLLEEITSLVEWPVVLTASFEEKFLAVPTEALVYTMTVDQKYFPVYDYAGKLMPKFILVANIESTDPQKIINGNEKVLRSRFTDAEFFFNTDRKKRLEERLSSLDTVLFQKQLGTMRDKSDRIESLATWVAARIGANVQQAARAGRLSKCDLMTKMVLEFTDIQGVMGMYYARYDQEPETVALAQKEQYQPRSSKDALPTTLVSCAVAIADKMDTLVGIIGIGQHPKGDKDPFAMRRAALGVLRIIVGKQLPLDLKMLTEEAVHLYLDKLNNNQVVNDVIDFMLGRCQAWYQDQGHRIDTIQAVLARRPTRPMDFDARVRAVSYFRQLEEAAALATVNKRVSNILAKAVDHPINTDMQVSLLYAQAEITLATKLGILREKLQPMFEDGLYQDALVAMAALHQPIVEFFDNVVVMSEDKQIRINRLTLLAQLRELFLQVADISLLQ